MTTMHKRRTSKLSLEPNPFEHSFSLVRSEDVLVTSGMHSDGEDIEMADAVCTATKQTAEDNNDSHGWIDTGDTAASASAQNQPDRADSASTLAEQRVTLPPVTAISGPMHAADMTGVWGAESLRSGPLSPAMLGGPAASAAKAQPPRITPRLGLTDPVLHTGLTPYINGEVQPMAAVAGFDAIKLPSALATPGIQAVIKAALEGQEISTTPGGSLQIASSGTATAAASAAAAAAAAAAAIPTTSISLTAPPLVAASMAAASPPHLPLAIEPMSTQIVPTSEKSLSEETVSVPAAKKATAKRRKTDAASENSRGTPAAKRTRTAKKKASASPAPSAKAQKAASAAIKESPKAESDAESGQTPSDEEKRRQFLERNRVAALKCRQRKKKQLKELQERHDFVAMQNESLRTEYLRLREKSLHLRALLTAHRDCPVAQSSGVFGVDNLPLGTPSVALQPLLFGNASEGEHVKEIIAAIPPASNGVPVHAVDPNTGKPVMVGIPAVAPQNAVDMIVAAAMAATAAAGPAPTQVALPVMPATVGTASTHATVAAAAAAAASMMPLAQSAVVVPTTATTAAAFAPGFTS